MQLNKRPQMHEKISINCEENEITRIDYNPEKNRSYYYAGKYIIELTNDDLTVVDIRKR